MIFLLLIELTFALITEGTCEKGVVEAMTNVDVSKMAGNWYPGLVDPEVHKGFLPDCT